MYWYKNMPDRASYDDLKHRDTFSAKLSRAFIEFLILGFIVLVVFVLFSGISYVDVPNQCYIKVKYDVLNGDRDSIVEALERLKQEDYIFYRRFCANVDAIYEKKCVRGDDLRPDLEFIQSEGCYIKGSKAILIKPYEAGTRDIVKRRKDAIREYGGYAIDYWHYDAPDLLGKKTSKLFKLF